ncbi:MAG: chemotaxis protein CheW [Fibrobacterales bacterium]
MMTTGIKTIEETKNRENGKLVQLATFRIAGRLLGVDILDVKEVCDNISITPIHHASQKICGYMNIRGQILLVVDLRTEFGFDERAVDEKSKVVVFKDTVDEPFGILVDSVENVADVFDGQITDRRDTEVDGEVDSELLEKRMAKNDLCKGVCPLVDELVLILNSKAVLE